MSNSSSNPDDGAKNNDLSLLKVVVTDDFKKEVELISQKFCFPSGYDFLRKIIELPTRAHLWQKGIATSPRPTKTKSELTKLANAFEGLLFLFDKTALDTKSKVDACLLGQAAEENQKNINMLNTHEITKMVSIYLEACKNANNAIQMDQGGVKRSSKLKYIYFALAVIYIEATGKLPYCQWDRVEEQYYGEFFDFILHLRPVLKKMNYHLGSSILIGKTLQEVLLVGSEQLKTFLLEQNITE